MKNDYLFEVHFAFSLILQTMNDHFAIMIDDKWRTTEKIHQVRSHLVPRVRFIPSKIEKSFNSLILMINK